MFRKSLAQFILVVFIITLIAVCFGCSPSPDNAVLPDAPDRGEDKPDQDEAGDKDTGEETPNDAAAPPSATAPSGQLIAHFIDVGQGDAILIQTPTQNILIDGGDRGTTVVNYLKAKGVNSLDLVIGTHPHADHIGGLINVMQSIPFKEVIDSVVAHTTKTFEDYLNVIDQKGIIFTEGRTGMTRDLGGGAELQILHPTSPSASHLNDVSIVLRITFGEISFMLTSDAEEVSERQILERGGTLTSTILKVGEHGSKASTTSSFLSAVNPEAGIIMCGKGNTYGHPHDETLAKLDKAGVKIYRTDLHGTIVISTDGQTYDINIKEPYQYNPPAEPHPAPTEPEEELKIVSLTDVVKTGQTASITIQGTPGIRYSITVTYSSGPGKAQGLEPKTAGADGKVTWAWKVGTNTKEGTFPISISGGGEEVSTTFTVIK